MLRVWLGHRVSVVFPAYNEEAGIAQAVAEADDALCRLTPDYEILVVDDGSTDRTAAVVAELLPARPRVRLLRHSANFGYGAALRTGFDSARCDAVWLLDSDGQFDPADLRLLLPPWSPRTMVVAAGLPGRRPR